MDVSLATYGLQSSKTSLNENITNLFIHMPEKSFAIQHTKNKQTETHKKG